MITPRVRLTCIWLIILSAVLAGCSEDMPHEKTKVYVAGVLAENGTTRSIIWQDGISQLLGNPGSLGGTTRSLFVSGDDVYVTGLELDGMAAVAKYWKNGVETVLEGSSATTLLDPQDIVVANGHVHVVGYTNTSPLPPGFRPVYWKDGLEVPITLPDPDTLNYFATALDIQGADVYISGYMKANDSAKAYYWVNGNPVELHGTPGSKFVYAEDITVVGADTYVIGYQNSDYGGESTRVSVVWKNGVPAILPGIAPGAGMNATAVFVAGSDVHIVGYEVIETPSSYQRAAVYWKNGTVSLLTDLKTSGGLDCGATSIFVDGSDVHIVGWSDDGVGGAVNAAQAVYWKNGKASELVGGTRAMAVFVRN